MNVGVPTEIKPDERRVALTPAGARELTGRGHRVLVQRGAGAGSGFPDSAYLAAGAECTTVSEVFAEAELVLKVKEPLPGEVEHLSDRHTLFTYLHLAADPQLALALAATGARCRTVHASELAIEELLPSADLVIGAVLVPGARAPRLVRSEHLVRMRPGSVLVDISIDHGGCFETSRPTTHSDPVYEIDGVVHYCVTNMPGAVPATSTRALTNATLEYVLRVCDLGPDEALEADPRFARGLTVADGRIVHDTVAAAVDAAMTSA